MLAKLAKADGVVTQHEIDIIDRVMRHNMRLTPEAREFAIRVFNEAKNSTQSFADYARQMAQEFGGSPEILLSMMELLFVVAHADGRIEEAREELKAFDKAVTMIPEGEWVMGNQPAVEIMPLGRLVLEGEIEFKAGNRAKGLELLGQAVELEETFKSMR